MLKDDREKGKNVNEQARLIMLKLLRELDRICTKYDITDKERLKRFFNHLAKDSLAEEIRYSRIHVK